MVIEGKKIAEKILRKLKFQVEQLEKKGISPTLIIILVGKNPLSLSFIKQKQKKAESIGIKIIIQKLLSSSTKKRIKEVIQRYNLKPQVQGIIVQLPLPDKLQKETQEILEAIDLRKDVDGFLAGSPFKPAVVQAILKALKAAKPAKSNFVKWLKEKKILIIGRGPTAGKPIAQTFERLGYHFSVAHSQTKNLSNLTKKADIIISCVGKEKLIGGKMLKKGAIVIDVGMSRNRQGKWVGDLEEKSVSQVASFYTPTPGGIGPLTVASLLENLVKACYDKKGQNL